MKPVRWASAVLVAACLLSVAFAGSAWAGTATIDVDNDAPVVGDALTFSSLSSDCGSTFTWSVDGAAQAPERTGRLRWTFTTDGNHMVSVHEVSTYNDGTTCSDNTGSLTVDIRPGLAGTMNVTPAAPAPGDPIQLEATQTGGVSGYTYTWDLDGDGTYGDGVPDPDADPARPSELRRETVRFATTGSHVVRVQITDRRAHVVTVEKSIDVENPPPPDPTRPTPPAPPAPPAPPCEKDLTFQLSEFTTTGCFKKVDDAPATYQTTDAVKLNGVLFPDYGQTFTITYPSAADPGGHFTARDSTIRLASFSPFSGNVDWSLPTGGQGDEADLKTFSVLAGTTLFGLNVRGTIAMRIGIDAKGTHYAAFPLTIELPASFRSGPDPSMGRVTGSAALRVDLDGNHFDGLKLEAEDVWLGKLKVPQACFSYIPAGGQAVEPCETPSLDGVPYLTCNTDINTDRWDGNAMIELPRSGAQIAAFGGVAGGQVTKLGGFADNLGRTVPLATGVYLNRIGIGLCLNPPPFTLRGDIGVSIFPVARDESLATINGHVTYTDATDTTPWMLEVGGSVSVLGTPVGSGSVTFRSYGGIDFDLQAGIDLEGVASVDGGISGFIDPDDHLYNVSGFIRGCLIGVCAKGSGVVSSTGIAGCIEVGEMTDDYIVVESNPFRLRWVTRTTTLSAGFGHVWGTSGVDLLGGSCNFAPYLATRPAAGGARASAAAVSGLRQVVARGTTAVSLRVHGTHGPPAVEVVGPDGTRVVSPAPGKAAKQSNKYVLVPNKTDGTTDVLLMHPAAGVWTVHGAAGARSVPTRVDRAKMEAPPTLGAAVSGAAGAASRRVQVAYAVPAGTSVRLVERARGISQTIASSLHGRPCAGAPMRPGSGGQHALCARLSFRPSQGPGGTRKIQAIVTRKGVPLLQQDIASFRVAKLRLPSRVGPLRARRGAGIIQIAFPRSKGASRYLVTASLTDGRELTYDLAASCQAVVIGQVPAGVGAVVKVAGVRYDLAVGARRAITLNPGVPEAGPKGTTPRRQWKPRKVCS